MRAGKSGDEVSPEPALPSEVEPAFEPGSEPALEPGPEPAPEPEPAALGSRVRTASPRWPSTQPVARGTSGKTIKRNSQRSRLSITTFVVQRSHSCNAYQCR